MEKKTSDLISRSELFNKLATVPIKAESVETTTEIFKIVNSMPVESVGIAESVVERICDGYCKFPQIVHDDNDLDRICDNCPLDNIASARIESGSDLISRADAIEAVKQAIYNHDSAIMRITSLPSAEAVQEWIPCSERLPEERQDVYVTVLWDDYGDYITAYGMRTKFGWNLHSNAEGELIKGYTVVAWMPLPKPYEGGEDE